MANTENRNYPLPDVNDTVAEEFWKFLQHTLPMLDADVQALIMAVAQKAATVHGHTIDQVEGLTLALSQKMPVDRAFALSDLSDVQGAVEAPDGYVLVKVAGKFVAQSIAAAVGNLSVSIGQVTNLTQTLQSLEAAVTAAGKKPTVSTAAPSGGVDGDIWFQIT